MTEKQGDIWRAEVNWLCITTNGSIKNDGCGVMGRGVAAQAKKRFPGIDKTLGDHLRQFGNLTNPLIKFDAKTGYFADCGYTVEWILALPVKHLWMQKADPKLIEESLKRLHDFWEGDPKRPLVALPRPGCGNGGLRWEDVKPIVERILPESEFEVWSL